MKKIILTLLLLTIFFPLAVFAVQGTCSWHGGINCSAGADWDGSAICNDGWRDSSESFYSSSCTTKVFCSSATYYKLLAESQYDELTAQIDALSAQLNAIVVDQNAQLASLGLTGPDLFLSRQAQEINRQAAIKSLELSSKITPLQAEQRSEQNKVDNLCREAGLAELNAENEKQTEALKKYAEAISKPTCSNNSTLGSDNKCYCNNGYTLSGSTCITYDQWCQGQTGTHSHASIADNKCYCDSGYYYSNGSCIPHDDAFCRSGLGIGGIYVGNDQCSCLTGYILQNKKCVLAPTQVNKVEEIKPEIKQDDSPKINEAVLEVRKDIHPEKKKTAIQNISSGINGLFKSIGGFFGRIFK